MRHLLALCLCHFDFTAGSLSPFKRAFRGDQFVKASHQINEQLYSAFGGVNVDKRMAQLQNDMKVMEDTTRKSAGSLKKDKDERSAKTAPIKQLRAQKSFDDKPRLGLKRMS